MCNTLAGAGLHNPALCAPGGGQVASGAFSMALAISISSSSSSGAEAGSAAGAEAGKAGKHGKNGKAGKHGKNGKAGKHGKNGKGNQPNPLQSNVTMAIAMAMAGAGSAQGCNPMGQMAGAGQLGGMDQQQMLLGLMVGLMLANSQNNATAGANPGMGGFLNQFGRCGF
ncbi:hypothetical protein DYH09_20650 [bacterium CPR1]|nr:hypothetical protein [bacterium CPR1]